VPYLARVHDYALQGLTIHGAFPGHYVQYWHALAIAESATVYKKLFSSGTFAEGWAVLAERMMFENGYAEGEPENLLIHLKQALRVPLNAILDARLHTPKCRTRRRTGSALDILMRMGFQEEAEARGKLRRAKVSSTQLSTYFVGYVELSDLLVKPAGAREIGSGCGPSTTACCRSARFPPRDVRELFETRPRSLNLPNRDSSDTPRRRTDARCRDDGSQKTVDDQDRPRPQARPVRCSFGSAPAVCAARSARPARHHAGAAALVLGHEPVGEIVEVGTARGGCGFGPATASRRELGAARLRRCRFLPEERVGYCPEYQSWIQSGRRPRRADARLGDRLHARAGGACRRGRRLRSSAPASR